MIKAQPGAQKIDGFQANRNLMLDKTARADSIPGLEIQADDVKCTHASAIGQLDPEELFYLMSRGIPRNTAVEMSVQGFFDPLMRRIDLAAEQVEGPLGAALEVSVTDDGPGVPAADRERVFEPGRRLAPEREPAGLGVGLAICRAIVTAHGGSIRAEAAPGRGARFVFTLPCAPQRDASCAPPGGAASVPGADS